MFLWEKSFHKSRGTTPLNYKSLFKGANKCAILWGRCEKLMSVKSEGKRKKQEDRGHVNKGKKDLKGVNIGVKLQGENKICCEDKLERGRI